VAAAQQAIDGVKSVHVSGGTTTGQVPVTLDLSLVAGKGGRGSMVINGGNLQIVAVGPSIYINASSTFWNKASGKKVAALLAGKWLKAPAVGQFATFASLTDLTKLFNQLLTQHGTLSKGAATTVDGQKAIAITDKTKGGTLYVATTGKPYPIEIAKGASKITFDQIDQPVSITAPSGAISIPSQ
jgi:hypothetical protein